MDALLDVWRLWEPLVSAQCQAWLRHLAWAIVWHLVLLWPILRLWIALVRGVPIVWRQTCLGLAWAYAYSRSAWRWNCLNWVNLNRKQIARLTGVAPDL